MRVPADRIAIVRALPGLGEMLCAIPALRALRGTAPRATISLIGLDAARWIPRRFDTYVDEFIPFPGFPGMPHADFDAGPTLRFLNEMQEREFNVAIQLQSAGVAANVFTQLLGAHRTAGTVLPGTDAPDDYYVELRHAEAEPLRLVRVVENLGARPTRDAELEFIVGSDDEAELAEQGFGSTEYACLHPGRWDTQHVAKVADVLSERGLRIALVAPDDEHAAAVGGAMEGDATVITGLSLGATAALLRDATIAICDDGISQLAEAVGAASVSVFPKDADVARWGPLDRERHRVVGGPDHGGDATVADVIAAADALLAERRPRESAHELRDAAATRSTARSPRSPSTGPSG